MTWVQVDPERIPFDPARAEPAARRAVAGFQGPPTLARRSALQAALDEAFRDTYGPWAAGWLWGRGESELDGGPGTVWCCPSHCVLPRGEGLDATVARAVRALQEWRGHLERVRSLFASLPAPTEPERLEEAALELVAFAVEQTGCDSGWHSYAATLLSWSLQFLGAAPPKADQAARKALEGRFLSWCQPPDETVREVVEDFGTLAMRALR